MLDLERVVHDKNFSPKYASFRKLYGEHWLKMTYFPENFSCLQLCFFEFFFLPFDRACKDAVHDVLRFLKSLSCRQKKFPQVKELEKLTDGPVKIGTQCRQVRVDQGNRSESTFKVTAFESGSRIRFEGVSNPYRCDYLIEAVDEKVSRVTFVFELLDLELHMKPFEKLIRIAVQDGTERTVRNIKKIIEAENAEAAS